MNKFLHIVRRVGVVGDHRIKAGIDAVHIVKKRAHRRFGLVIEWQEIDQTAALGQGLYIVFKRAIRHRGFFGMGRGPAQFFRCHHLVCHGFDHVRAGHKHVRAVFDHKDKVGHRRAIDRPTRAWPHDQADLRHHTRGHDIALEHLGVARKGGHTLLDARPTGIVDPDHRRAVLHRHIHDLADFLRVGFRQRAAEDREVLGIHIDQPPVDRAPARHHTVAGRALFFHAKIDAAVGYKHVELFKRAIIKQQFNAFAGG